MWNSWEAVAFWGLKQESPSTPGQAGHPRHILIILTIEETRVREVHSHPSPTPVFLAVSPGRGTGGHPVALRTMGGALGTRRGSGCPGRRRVLLTVQEGHQATGWSSSWQLEGLACVLAVGLSTKGFTEDIQMGSDLHPSVHTISFLLHQRLRYWL